MKTFEEFRSEISIMELAASVGYFMDVKKGKKWPVLVSKHSGEKIIIVNPSSKSNQGYFNPDNSDDKGTLIDFIKHRLNTDFKSNPSLTLIQNINNVLYSQQNLPVIEAKDFKRSEKAFIPCKEDFQNFTNPGYLNDRGISNATLNSINFKNTIFNKIQSGFSNIAFPYKDGNGQIMGFEYRNHGYKMFSEDMDRSKSIWYSNIPQRLERIILSESPIDAISYHQLKEPSNALYVSFGGSLSEKQIPTINQLLNQHSTRSDNFHYLSIVDNDKMGDRYNVKLIEFLHPEKVIVDKPVQKDFNEDLQAKKNQNNNVIKL